MNRVKVYKRVTKHRKAVAEFKKLFDALVTEAARVLGVSEGELLEQLAEAA